MQKTRQFKQGVKDDQLLCPELQISNSLVLKIIFARRIAWYNAFNDAE